MTHAVQYLPHVDQIIVLQDGVVVEVSSVLYFTSRLSLQVIRESATRTMFNLEIKACPRRNTGSHIVIKMQFC